TGRALHLRVRVARRRERLGRACATTRASAQPSLPAREGQPYPAQPCGRATVQAFARRARRGVQGGARIQRRPRVRATPARARHIRRLRATRRAAHARDASPTDLKFETELTPT